MPVPFHLATHLVSLVGRVPVEAAVRTLRVVEQDGTFDRCSHLLQAGKRPSMKELVLDGIVDALGRRVVLRVATLGHAWRNVNQSQLLYVLRAGVLGAAVGVVDELVGSDSRVLSPDLTHELDDKLLYRKLAEQEAVVALVKGLPCHTGQRTKLTHRVPGLPFVQPSDCPVTAFFRISMPNISSATSTIVS